MSEVIQQVASDFFGQVDCDIEDCIRLAQIAAALGASVSESFQFVTRDGCRRPVSDCIVVDERDDLDTLVEVDWYEAHILHHDYNVLLSCTHDEWQQWVTSARSKLAFFLPLVETRNWVIGENNLAKELKKRGVEELPHCPYRSCDFHLCDCDFDKKHWAKWSDAAADEPSFWGRLFQRLLKQQSEYLQAKYQPKVIQVATNGHKRQLRCDGIVPTWILKFRELPCLQDTRGNFRHPAELLRRTPETESLLDVEPFVRAEFDAETTRPLLIMLGVRDTPTGPDRLLARLRALATVESPPVYEVEKWYHRLDQMLNKCSTEEFEEIKDAFADEKIILTEVNGWGNASEVFLAADEEDVPGAALVHPSVRHLTLWHKVSVADRPTAELAISWLASLDSGASLTADEVRRVRSLLPRYPERIWSETGHWLNLEGEWTATEDLVFSLTMQSLVAWKHLFKPTKQKTADLQKLSVDVCVHYPFSSLRPLAQSIEDRFEDQLYGLPDPQKRPWLNALGTTLRRVALDDDTETRRVRELADRLSVTGWQVASGLQTAPYIDGTPAGTPRRIDVLWKDTLLYVEDRSTAKMAKAVAQELGRVFSKQEIADAIKLCYDRAPEFVLEYLEENFRLLPKDQVGPIPEMEPQTGETAAQEEADMDDNATSPDATGAAFVQSDDDDCGSEGDDDHDDGIEQDAEEEQTAARRKQFKPTKPGLMERFTKTHGYTQDGEDRFYHSNGGWIEKVSGAHSFPWERRSANGELILCYWIKDHCIEREPLQIEADVWNLCYDHPEKYSLLLATPDGAPVEYSGTRLCELCESGRVTIFPARYRLVYEHDQAKEMADE